MKQIRKRLTYANVMSSIAVFLVLGGAAFAAVKLPKNSVGTKQLKNNAVTSEKVKDGSLLNADFAAGQLPAGPQGPKGEKGDKGDKGERGEKGEPGQSATSLWAVIASNGSTTHGSGVTGSHEIVTGAYEVDFNQNVSQCAYVATATITASPVRAEPRFLEPNGVFVEITNSSGTAISRGFNLAVFC